MTDSLWFLLGMLPLMAFAFLVGVRIERRTRRRRRAEKIAAKAGPIIRWP